MGNEQGYVTIGYRGLAVVGGVVVPHLVALRVVTEYSVQDNIKRYFSAGKFSIPYDKVRKAELSWFGLSPMLLSKLGAASVAQGGNKVIEGEENTVATNGITLQNPPLPDIDWPCSLYEKSGGEPSVIYLPVDSSPAQGQFTVVKTTGVIVFGGTVADGTKIYADYLNDQASDGWEIVLGDSFAGACDIMGIAGTVRMSDGTRASGSVTIAQAIPLGEPPILFGTGEAEEESVELSVKGEVRIHVDT